jgi:hypothetical protein
MFGDFPEDNYMQTMNDLQAAEAELAALRESVQAVVTRMKTQIAEYTTAGYAPHACGALAVYVGILAGAIESQRLRDARVGEGA